MTSFKFLGATLVLSALLATPASAWQTFSIYSNDGPRYSRTMVSQEPRGDASRLHMSVRPHRGNHTTSVKRY